MKSTALYIRVSTDMQETVSQETELNKYVQRLNIENPIVYKDEAISGKTERRPAYQRLKKDIAEGKIERLIAFDSSRISRDMTDFMNFIKLLNKNKVELHYPDKGLIKTESATEQLVAIVNSFTAAQFLEDHSRRTKAGIEAWRLKNPDKTWGGNIGNKAKKGMRKTYAPKLIRQIELAKSKGMTTREIAELLDISQSKVSRIMRRHVI